MGRTEKSVKTLEPKVLNPFAKTYVGMPMKSAASLSPEFREFARLFKQADGPILDAPAGYGRHAFALQQMGHSVTCVDLDQSALEHLTAQDKISDNSTLERLQIVNLDLVEGIWPFGPNTFGGVVNVHFLKIDLLENFTFSLKQGGLLYLETVANRGGNYLELPERGELRTILLSGFEILHYKEKPAGPDGSNKVTVRLLAQKL